MSKNMNRIYHLLGFILFLPFFGNSQQLPVSAVTIMNAPHPVYVNEYYSIGSNALQGIITLNDLNEPSWDVRLLVTIEGEGIRIKTKQSFLPSNPINLTSGIPSVIEGSLFAQYLDVNNVDLEGITAASLNQSGKLPEGIYNFCIEVLDYVSGVPLSLPSCAPAFIFFDPPPVTLQPECEGVVVPSDPQIVNFSWQIAGSASPDQMLVAMNSLYQLSVYEVTEEGSDPYFAVANNHALLVYESDFINQTQNQIDFGINTTSMLTPGKQYVYRVRAVDGDGKDIYRNNGFSEWCWFFYGYPHDGNLAITTPEDEHIYGKFESKSFGWNVSDLGVPGQEYNYMAVIKELNEGQEKEDAMDVNPDWYVKNLPTTSSLNGAGFPLSQTTEPGTTYIWQVTAYTGAQEVAKSEIYTFYSAPLVDHFMAGPNRVEVVSISNGELENLSGVGRLQVSANEEDIVEFEFENLNVSDLGGGDYALVDGEAIIDLSNLTPVELTPNIASNGVAVFSFTTGSLNSSGIQTNGEVSWPFPHATSSGELVQVKSANAEFSINSAFQINGEVNVLEDMELELLEPNNFKFEIGQASSFQIMNGTYSLSFTGSISSNSDVKTNDGNPFLVNFTSLQSVHYFEISSLLSSATNYLQPSDGLEIGFMPKSVIIDLSEEQSPEKLSGTPGWKGFYFPEFQVRISPGATDATGQFSVSEIIDFHEDQTNADFWLENEGLKLDYEYALTQEGITFNGFVTEITGNFNVENNQISSSNIIGEINIPVIDKVDGFGFEIPVTNDGLAQGYLNEDLTQRDMVFNPYGGENRVDITINRAVFAENERLDLEIDADLTGISALVSGISDFRVYGDNTIGIGSKNGSNSLDTQVEGEYKGFAAYVSEVGASLFNGNYVFSYVAALDMGEDVVGEDGPPLLAISSVEEVGGDVVLPDFSPTNPQPEPAISVPEDINPGEPTLTTYEMFIAINNVIVDMEGYLKLSNNDPTWGTSFRGGINGSLKVPTQIDVGANMIFGDRDGVKFWYFDAYFNDREGLGIPVPPLFNLVAMEGKIYHHMSKNETEYVIDPEMAFGAGLYMQIIDNQTGGTLFAVDAGAEIQVLESGDFTISMSGDGSFLNTNRRTAGGGMTSAVGEAIVEEALEAIGPISLTFSVGGGDLTIEAEGLTKGSMDFAKGDLAFGFDAELGSTPGIGFNYSKGPGSLSFNANAAGSFGVGLGLDGKSLSLGIQGTNEGYLDLTYDDVSFATRINRADKTGTLAFAYGDKSIDFGVETDGGYLNLELSSDLKFETGFNTAGSAYLGLAAGTNEFSISGDKESGEGSFDLSIDGLAMNTNVNTLQKSASFALNTSGVTLDVSGEYGKGGTFLLDVSDTRIDVGADLEDNTGHIDLVSGDKRLFAELTESSQGSLLLKNGEQEFGISGNTEGTAGSVHYKDNTAEFTIAADRTNNTGNIGLSFDDKILASGVTEDSSYINIAFSDVELNVQSNNQNKGMIEVIKGSNQIKVNADLEEKSGSLLLTDGSNSIFAKGAADATGELDISIDNNTVRGVVGETESSLFVSSGEYEFSIEGSDDGSGLVGFKKGNIETRLGVNIPQTAGEIYVGDGGDFIHLKGNKTENTGLIDIKKSSLEFTAILDDSIHMYSGPASLTRRSDGTGFMRYNDGNLGVGLYKYSSEIGLGLGYAGNELYLSHGTSTDFDSVYYNGNGQTVSASIAGNMGRIGLTNSLGSFGLSANTSGVGSISFAHGDLGVTVTGDINNESGSFEFEKGDLKMDGSASLSDESFGIGFEKGNILSELDYSPTLQKITFGLTNNFSISAQKEDDTYTTVFTKGDHSLKGTVQGSLKEIEYEGMGATVILGNDREYVSYSGHSLLVQNNKVYVDDEEVYDYTNVPDVNWSQVFTFGDVQVRPYIDGGNSAVTLLKGADSVYVQAADLQDGMIRGYVAGNDLLIEKEGSNYSVKYDDYEASLEGSELTIKQGATNQLRLTPTEGSLVYDNYEVSASSTEGLNYTDGYNSTSISSTGISAESGDKQMSYNQEKELFVQYEEGKNFKIHPQNGLEVNFDGKALAISEDELSYSEEGRAYSVSPTELSFTEGDKQLIVSEERSYLAYDAQNSLEYTGGVLTASHDEKSFTISDEKEITYNDPNRSLAISPEGMSLAEDGKSVSLSPDEMEIILSEDKKLKIEEHLLSLQYVENEVRLGSEALYFTNGTETIDLSQDELALSQDDNSIYLSESAFGMAYGANKSLSIDKADQKVSFTYDDIQAEFSNGESLSFSDGTRSFELGTSGLSMSDGDRGIAVLNEEGAQAIELTDGEDRFFVNNSGFEVDYSGKHFAINDEEYLHVDIDDSRFIEVNNNSAKYSDNGTELIIGGDDNFLELKNGTKSVALTQDEKLSFVDGNYAATLSKELEIEMTDGERTIGLFTPTHYVTYEQGDYELGIRGGSGGNKPGVDVTAYGHTIYVEGERNEDVTVGVESPDFGEVAFTVDAQKNIETRFINGSSVYGFIKDESGITPITGSEPVPPEAEYLEGSGTVEAMDGPSHLTNSIADEGGGSIRGQIELSFDSENSRFVANAAVAGNSPVCIEGAMALDVSPSRFKLDLGTEEQRIEVYPTCSGFGGGGWLGIESTSSATTVDLGVFVGWRASASVEIGSSVIGAGLSAEASAELGVKATAELYPDFQLLEAGIWLDLYVAIRASYWAVGVSGSCTLAEAGLSGELLAKFLETETQVSGSLSGYVTVLDIISASFDMSFNTSF